MGRLFGLSLIGFAILAIFWDDRVALLAIVPATFSLSTALSAAINVTEQATVAQAFSPVLLFLAPALALYAGGAYILDATVIALVLVAAAGVVALAGAAAWYTRRRLR